jgi:1,4-dihydroxy-2-naphthoyl-CoA hydrolase
VADDLARFVAVMPFAVELSIVLEAAGPDEARGRLSWAPELCTAGGVLHGGVLMALADSVGAVCASLNIPEGGTTTTSSSTVFLRGVREGEVAATARPLHAGRTVVVVRTDLADGAGRPVAQVTQTQAVLAAP